MLTRTALSLLLLLPAAASAQELDTAVSALVRISGTRGDTPVRGSGFVVGLDGDKATIVTTSHVIEGAQQVEVTFAADLSKRFLVDVVFGLDAGNPHGLAVFQARGVPPAAVTSLSFEVESRPRLGEALFLLGFPQMELAPRTTQRVLSSRRGTLLLIDQQVGEGFSGGPVLQGGRVVGVVTDMDSHTTFAVNAVVAREALEGWGVRINGQGNSPERNTTTTTTASAAGMPTCQPGAKRIENGITFVRMCPGSFIMGSDEYHRPSDEDERPAHMVMLNEFWIGKTEITNEQYRGFRPDHQGEASLPATGVGWIDAKAACERFGGRLPTEAEWEFAARAGSQTAWSFGNSDRKIDEYAWYIDNAGKKPQAVGTKKPNAWGLHDMHGNAWEWVSGWYGHYPRSATDPFGPNVGGHRMVRGGSFNHSSRFLRSANRLMVRPSFQTSDYGFRCVLETCPGRTRTEAGIEYVRICPGSFIMGSREDDDRAYANEKPAHPITLSAFWMAKTELTNEQYRRFRPSHQGDNELPATEVSWTDASSACKHLGGRLPTEAEWEYAARAGSQTAWSFGDDDKSIAEHTWYINNSEDTAHAVGTKKPNPWGLRDLHGNVWEWVSDWYDNYPRVGEAGSSSSEGAPERAPEVESRVLRGGDFGSSSVDTRSAIRYGERPSARSRRIGFRCALSDP